MSAAPSPLDTLVSAVACREALTAVSRAVGGDRVAAITGLVGALIILASTAPIPTETLTEILASLEEARPVLLAIRARVAAAATTTATGGLVS